MTNDETDGRQSAVEKARLVWENGSHGDSPAALAAFLDRAGSETARTSEALRGQLEVDHLAVAALERSAQMANQALEAARLLHGRRGEKPMTWGDAACRIRTMRVFIGNASDEDRAALRHEVNLLSQDIIRLDAQRALIDAETERAAGGGL